MRYEKRASPRLRLSQAKIEKVILVCQPRIGIEPKTIKETRDLGTIQAILAQDVAETEIQ